MNYKRFLAIFCAAASLLAFSGCSSDKTESADADAVSTSSTEDVEESSEESTTTTKKVTTATTKSSTTTGKTTTKTTQTSTKSSNSSSSNSSADSSSSNSGNNSGNNSSSNSGSNGNNSSNSSSSNNSSSNSNSSSNNSNSNSSGSSNSSNSSSSNSSNNSTVASEEETYTMITLSDSGCSTSDNTGVSISGTTVTLTAEGRYEFSGTLSNGQIIINATKEEKVDIYLNGVSITCSSSAPIYVASADTCTIHLQAGSTNYIADTSANDKNAAIFSKDDLTIKGSGQMTVVGNKKHAIKSSNDVKVKNGTLSLAAVAAGIYGEDSIQISGGSITITSCKDGLKACDSTEIDGYITVEDGYIDVQNATGNGMQADVSITISGGSVYVHSTKKGINCDNATYATGCYSEY